MVVSEAPAFDAPTRKQTVYNVAGRNGAVIFQEDAWEDITRSYDVWCAYDNDTLRDKVIAFEAMLNSKKGYQRLEDSFEPDVFRLAYYQGGDGFSNVMTAYGEATLNFTCRPERFLKSGEIPFSVSNGDKIVNPTRFSSKPLIKITVPSYNIITILCGGKVMQARVTDYIYIDSDSMNAYRQTGESMNDKISGNFPIILAGTSTITITGSVTSVEVTPRYFTI